MRNTTVSNMQFNMSRPESKPWPSKPRPGPRTQV